MSEHTVTVRWPQRMAYDDALRLQIELRDACIEGPVPGGAEGRGGEWLLFVEHPPTITIGRKGSRSDVLASDDELKRMGVTVVKTGRGGEVTYHGPGQLVAYPIVDLRRRGSTAPATGGCDLHRYLRDLETWLVNVCRSFGLPAHAGSPQTARPGPPQTGVWIEDRKIASIGIAVRRWVSYHGVALNVSTDLSHFDLIVPCGLPGVKMTSLGRELGAAPPLDVVARRAAAWFAEVFQAAIVEEDAR